MRIMAAQASMTLGQGLARHFGVTFCAGLGGLVRMPLVARVTFLMRGWFPGINRRNIASMAGNACRATLRLPMHRMAAPAIRMIAPPRNNRVVTVVAHEQRSSGRTVPLMARSTTLTMCPELRRPMAIATDVVVRCELMR